MSSSSSERSQQPRMVAAQWLALVGPPLIWLLQFGARYALSGNTSGSPGHIALVVIGVTSLIAIAACVWLAWQQWREAEASPLDRLAAVGERARFMGALGLLIAGLFLLGVCAQMLADLFVRPGMS